jgi:hypothetical protein
MTGEDDLRGAANDRDGDRGDRVADPAPEAAGPEDLQDTWNTTHQAWDREQSPVDALGDFSDEQLYQDQQRSGPRRSGI